MSRQSLFRSLGIGITWFWLGVFALVPTVGLLLVAFLDRGELDFFIPQFTTANFAHLVSPIFLTVLWDTLRLAFLSTLSCLLVGYPFAYVLAKSQAKYRSWLLLLLIIPFWTNSLIRTYALILVVGAQGLLNKFLLSTGILSVPFEILYTDAAVFIGLSYTLLPFMILPLFASMEKLNPNFVDAAKDLGANSFQAFYHIVLPLTFPGIVAGCMLVFLPALGCFYVPEVLGGATNMLLGTFIKNQFLVANNWPLGAAASSIMTFLLLLLAFVYRLVNARFSGSKGDQDLLVSSIKEEAR